MSKVPKILMQTWKTRDIPDKWKPGQESVQKHLVSNGWQHILMTDEDNRSFVEKHFPDFLPYYDGFKYGIQRADAIRYLWLYVNGGVYLDLDFVVQSDFYNLFSDGGSLYFVREANFYKHYVTNCFMASEPKNPFWLEVIQAMKDVQDKGLQWTQNYSRAVMILYTTGPNILDQCLRETRHSYVYLSNKLINPCSTCDVTCDAQGAFLRPLQGRSWVTPFEEFITYNFVCHPYNGASYIILIILLILAIIFAFIILFTNFARR